ncbi:MAG: UDP-3-O-acyl-N-acetylglucosamine deacetylase [Alphaproteobacteria bacterium]
MFEKTLKKIVEFNGIGLHSGEPVKMSIYPQKSGGIRFRRSDIFCSKVIPATFSAVINTHMNTTIGTSEKNYISTIEHLMGAFCIAGIDHAFIEISAPEIPIMDGSAKPFLDKINKIGLLQLETKKKKLIVKKAITFENETAKVELHPADHFEIIQSIDFENDIIGKQNHRVIFGENDIAVEISSARTFGNIADHEKLKKAGLAKGATLDNLLVYDDKKILSPSGLRFENEVVRHKILDSIGDLFTSGFYIQGKFITDKGGHFHNNELLKKLFADENNYEII